MYNNAFIVYDAATPFCCRRYHTNSEAYDKRFVACVTHCTRQNNSFDCDGQWETSVLHYRRVHVVVVAIQLPTYTLDCVRYVYRVLVMLVVLQRCPPKFLVVAL